jgi:hypothetical protein
MRKVYESTDPIQVAQLRALLEANHITCMVRNDFLMGAAGELPVLECWPELWVIENFQFDKARALVDAFAQTQRNGTPWTCPDCTEHIEPAFSQCWNCGHERVTWE